MPPTVVHGRWQLPSAIALTIVIAFGMYRATLLPGLDFGDTAAFQDAGGQIEVTPRQGYPLYFAIGNLVVWTTGGEPAHGMNLMSALCGALACGAIVWLAAMLTGSVVAGLFGGLLYGASYTFWSQSIIAEVYALHLLMLAASLIALLWWGERPDSLRRLAVFFLVYAIGFGNHLMMVLLMPAATVYLVLRIPRGIRGLLAPRVLALAIGCAAVGAAQYAWNLRYLWSIPTPPDSIWEAVRTFWFDVTKSDWRSTMVVGIDRSAYSVRVGMYRFDLLQQFGVPGLVLAAAGVPWLLWRDWRRFVLLLLGYAVAAAFAYTYNVGDAHVFFLPSHLFVALAASAGVAAALRGVAALSPRARAPARWPVAAAAILAVAYPAWRIYDTWPAVDRSRDRRPVELMDAITRGLSPDRDLFLADLNWQLQNGLDYYNHHLHPELLQLQAAPRALTLPWLIGDNVRAGRNVVLTAAARGTLERAYGDLFAIEPDPRVLSEALADRVARLARGTPYVFTLLEAYPDVPLDAAECRAAVARLTSGTATLDLSGVYTIMAGRVGERPQLVRADPHPFRVAFTLDGLPLEVRMESWLPADTMRRAGFGHVILRHAHAFTLERGVSLVAFDRSGRPVLATYASGLFAPAPRFIIRPRPPALRGPS